MYSYLELEIGNAFHMKIKLIIMRHNNSMNILQRIFADHYEKLIYILHPRQVVEKIINCTHRHVIFTIDDSLRHYFLENRHLLNNLFRAVCSVVLRMFYDLNKSKNYVPGMICVLHTFRRSLQWNPHIHCLITEGRFSDDGFW